MINRRGEAEWFWIMISIIIAIVVAIFILMLFTDFGTGIKDSFEKLNDLADPSEVPNPYEGLEDSDDDDDDDDDAITSNIVANPLTASS
jgi:hypothetical protein